MPETRYKDLPRIDHPLPSSAASNSPTDSGANVKLSSGVNVDSGEPLPPPRDGGLVKDGVIEWTQLEELALRLLKCEEEVSRRLAFEDLLWTLLRQLWENHWELNIDLVCWLDDCRCRQELQCVLDLGRGLWHSLTHLRKMAVKDMTSNATMVNELVKTRHDDYAVLHATLRALTPAYVSEGKEELSSLDFRARMEHLWGTTEHHLSADECAYFLALLNIQIQVDAMVIDSADGDRAKLWTESQQMYAHNDVVTRDLLITPLQVFQGASIAGRKNKMRRELLVKMAEISRTPRGYAIPPYTTDTGQAQITPPTPMSSNGIDASRCGEIPQDPIPPDRKADAQYIWEHLSGPMWLCAAAFCETRLGVIAQTIGQALAVCARSSQELSRATVIASESEYVPVGDKPAPGEPIPQGAGSVYAVYNFLKTSYRPKLQRCSTAPTRPALMLKLEDSEWKYWAGIFGEPFRQVIQSCLLPLKSETIWGEAGRVEPSKIDLIRIRTVLAREGDKDALGRPQWQRVEPFDESQTRKWFSSLIYLQEWIGLKELISFPGDHLQARDSSLYIVSEQIPTSTADQLITLAQRNPLLTKIIGYSLAAGVSIACRSFTPYVPALVESDEPGPTLPGNVRLADIYFAQDMTEACGTDIGSSRDRVRRRAVQGPFLNQYITDCQSATPPGPSPPPHRAEGLAHMRSDPTPAPQRSFDFPNTRSDEQNATTLPPGSFSQFLSQQRSASRPPRSNTPSVAALDQTANISVAERPVNSALVELRKPSVDITAKAAAQMKQVMEAEPTRDRADTIRTFVPSSPASESGVKPLGLNVTPPNLRKPSPIVDWYPTLPSKTIAATQVDSNNLNSPIGLFDDAITKRLIDVLDEIKAHYQKMNPVLNGLPRPSELEAMTGCDYARASTDWEARKSVGPRFTCYSLPVNRFRETSQLTYSEPTHGQSDPMATLSYSERLPQDNLPYAPEPGIIDWQVPEPFSGHQLVTRQPEGPAGEVYYEPVGAPFMVERQ